MSIYQVVAKWDDEANVWVATSDDIPGLVTEAETKEHLVKRLQAMVPELLELNRSLLPTDGDHDGRHEFNVHWSQEQRVAYT